ncbi:ABC transporter ATP-binding protein [Cereibacter sediminicola]|uniref:ABC transporter ATP-binding protein n=1 Tax=Cereibacter sediminicola TaxID=2584941 RepID=UPI0011A1DAEE|nr:ABC transporter ATP-binding protein [Cereibacter sediminicola]
MPRTPDDPRYTSGRLFGRLWTGYLRRHTGTMALAFLLNVMEGSTLGALSWLIQPLFDQVFAPGGNRLLLWVGLAILGLFVLRGATSVASKALLTRVSQISSTAMQVDLLRHILTLDQGFFQKNPPGALMERVQGDTTAVQGVWSSVILGMGRDVVSLIGLFTVALLIDPIWTLAALVGAPILILPAVVVQRYIRRKTQQMRVQAGERSTRLDEIFHGIQPIKLNRMEGYQLARFRRISDLIVRGQLKMAVGRAAMPALIDVITGIGFFAVLMLGGREIAAGERTTGEFMSFFTAMALTFQPLRRLGDLSGFWQIAAASLERIYRLFDTEPEVIRRPASAAPKAGTPDIRLENVHFSYDGHAVLNGLTLRAAPGRMTALVGPSGAGKSTVFHLLTGLIEPSAGRVLINGVDAADMDLADLRAQFAVVSQEAGLFDETIRENVTLGREVPEDRLRASLEAAHVTDFMDLLPEGDLTPAGPRGSRLSGGQRQRVAIARALVSDAPVLLLDEATSALDAASEALVAEALARLGEGRTTLVIAHRLSTVRQADRIVVMEAGRVADEGTHEELLARGGLYAELHRLQFRNGEADAG